MPSASNIIVGGARVFIGNSDPTGANGYTDDTGANEFFATTGTGVNTAKSITDGYLKTGGDNTKGLAGYTTGAFKEVGFTSEGFDLSFEPEFNDVEVDQLLDSAILFKTKQKVTAKTSLTEATLVNLARAIGQKDTESDTAGSGVVLAGTTPGTWNEVGDTKTLGITGGALGSFPQEKGLIAVANGPRYNALTCERVFEGYRGISVESVGVAVKRNEVTSFPVSFRFLPGANGRYMKIADRVFG